MIRRHAVEDGPREVLKTSEVARLLGVNPTTVLSWAYRGLFDYTTTPGGQRRFYRDQIEAYLAAQYSRPVEPGRGQVETVRTGRTCRTEE